MVTICFGLYLNQGSVYLIVDRACGLYLVGAYSKKDNILLLHHAAFKWLELITSPSVDFSSALGAFYRTN